MDADKTLHDRRMAMVIDELRRRQGKGVIIFSGTMMFGIAFILLILIIVTGMNFGYYNTEMMILEEVKECLEKNGSCDQNVLLNEQLKIVLVKERFFCIENDKITGMVLGNDMQKLLETTQEITKTKQLSGTYNVIDIVSQKTTYEDLQYYQNKNLGMMILVIVALIALIVFRIVYRA